MKTKLYLMLIILLLFISNTSAANVMITGNATQKDLAYSNGYFTVKGASILPSAAIDFLAKNPGYTVEVTTSPLPSVREKGMAGAVAPPVSERYVLGSKVPSDFSSRTFNVVYKSASVPIPVNGGGSAAAYWLMGRKWTQVDPQIKMSIKDDSFFAATGMSRSSALAAVSAAANTWDNATYRNLFIDSGANFTNTVNWKYDHINNMAFTPYATGCSALAATGVWYNTQGIPAGQMYPIVESDMTFNSNLKWTTTGESGKLDFQSVVLHELGHTIGLGDLYGRAQFASDTRQVMHYYTGVKRALGNGDIYGLWMLYN